MDQVLARVPRISNENVLVGFDTADDAGVYRLTPDCALVQTVDFFTPIVDDAFTFGAVAAANSLSDVYAMGGRPISALSIVCYPGNGDLDELADVLRGGAEKMREAGCVVLGGHSVDDSEVKFGYAVTGTIHPGRVMTNAGARPGDILLLTKRIGTGVITTALKRGMAAEEHVQAAVESMLALNREACERMLEFDTHASTDVTGFGLLGHAREMAVASGVTLEINADLVRMLPGAPEYAAAGALPGGLNRNRDFIAPCVAGELTGRELLFDPQTSGGLLISMPEDDATAFEKSYPAAYQVGRVFEKAARPLRIL